MSSHLNKKGVTAHRWGREPRLSLQSVGMCVLHSHLVVITGVFQVMLARRDWSTAAGLCLAAGERPVTDGILSFLFFSATGEWKATPRRVLILMTRHRGIRRFSLNCNYKHGRGKSICPCVTPVRQKTHAADAGGVSPQWTGALQIPPTIASSQEFQYSPVPLLPTAFPGRSSLFRAANNDQSSLLSIGDQRWWNSWNQGAPQMGFPNKSGCFLFRGAEDRFPCRLWFGGLTLWQFHRHLISVFTAFKWLYFKVQSGGTSISRIDIYSILKWQHRTKTSAHLLTYKSSFLTVNHGAVSGFKELSNDARVQITWYMCQCLIQISMWLVDLYFQLKMSYVCLYRAAFKGYNRAPLLKLHPVASSH